MDDAKIREFVATPDGRDHQLGLLIDVLAITAEPSCGPRLRVEDLRDHPVLPKLMMPKSAKGGAETAARKSMSDTASLKK